MDRLKLLFVRLFSGTESKVYENKKVYKNKESDGKLI